MKIIEYDKIIIGAGIYGLYAATYCGRKGENVLVIECEKEAFSRATYVNQARVHMGYHYPRSVSTATKSKKYFERFCNDYKECIFSEFQQIYAISNDLSYTNSMQFKKFCDSIDIECLEINTNRFFKEGKCESAFITKEYTYDARLLRDIFLKEISNMPNVLIQYNSNIERIEMENELYSLHLNNGDRYFSRYILNATYASTNQIISKIRGTKFNIKYELCEIILCDTNEYLKNIGITVMDGPFFSIMPFGKTGVHSLTSVSFTPHSTSYGELPQFSCMNVKNHCNQNKLDNCNKCLDKPKSAWPYMAKLANNYMLDKYEFNYKKSLFSVKPILTSAEIDDSRPTVIHVHSKNPTFISVLSG